ncbi:MAG: hypothetical protein H7Y01_02760 [Ferruginibacter sp.]|nr:hypothetical protein [Chitinophagaceae bacterium]
MRLFIFTASIVLLSCGQNSSDKQKEVITGDTTKIAGDTTIAAPGVKDNPPGYTTPDQSRVNGMLTARYGNKWHVLNDSEAKWMKDAFDYFIVPKRKENPNYPYIARGDYNADGKEDMAAVITDSLKNTYQMAILLDTSKIILWKEDILEDAAISTVPKSEIEGMEGEKTKKVKLKGDGINVEYFEKAAFVLYWSGREFKRIQTAD